MDNGAGPYLFLVDSDMAGGGPVTVYPFTVDLTLGDARQEKVRGMYGALPPCEPAAQKSRGGKQ